MVVRIHLFGPEAEAIGADFVDVQTTGTCTCSELLQALQRLHPQLSGRIAVNHAFAPEHQHIREGDEVALIGLVSGG